MLKREKTLIKGIALSQIFLVVMFVFSFSFIIGNAGVVYAQADGVTTVTTFCDSEGNCFNVRSDGLVVGTFDSSTIYNSVDELTPELYQYYIDSLKIPTTISAFDLDDLLEPQFYYDSATGGATKKPSIAQIPTKSSSGSAAALDALRQLAGLGGKLSDAVKDADTALAELESDVTANNLRQKATERFKEVEEKLREEAKKNLETDYERIQAQAYLDSDRFKTDRTKFVKDMVTNFENENPSASESEVAAVKKAAGKSWDKEIAEFKTGAGIGAGAFFSKLGKGLSEGLTHALFITAGVQLIGSLAGLESSEINSINIAAVGTSFTYDILQEFGFTDGAALGWGLIAGAALLYFTYKKESQEVVQFQCLPWEAALGGSQCGECTADDDRPCTEYRCRSLGQACELVNAGSEEEACVWVNPKDVTPPTITPWTEPLEDDLQYTNHDTRPPSLGTKIIQNDKTSGCLDAFTPLEFGILTDEPAQCKIDFTGGKSYEEMQFLFGNTNFLIEEHEQLMRLPGSNPGENGNLILENNGDFDLYVRCQDANGNSNEGEFVFNFCVDPSPDTTPPSIVRTSINTGSPVAFGSNEVDIDVFVNELADCKWSIDDKGYDSMENTMTCTNDPININAEQLYTCSTTLTGVQDRAENNYYFRCRDQPGVEESKRNTNVQSFKFTLFGTQELNIIDVSPENETITGSTSTVTVELSAETSNGESDGRAFCFFSTTGNEGSFIEFFETDSFVHSQDLTLNEGSYDYTIRCVDLGGNSDETVVSFSVETDTQSPLVTRAYKDLGALKIVTNEDAQCVYSLTTCNYNFEDGLVLELSNPSIRNSHFAPWDSNNAYHIKCIDDFGNEPSPNQCSIIVSASNVI